MGGGHSLELTIMSNISLNAHSVYTIIVSRVAVVMKVLQLLISWSVTTTAGVSGSSSSPDAVRCHARASTTRWKMVM